MQTIRTSDMMEKAQAENKAILERWVRMAFWHTMPENVTGDLTKDLDKGGDRC